MTANREYHELVKRLVPATVAALAAMALIVFLAAPTAAQINGVAPSVTSPSFGGHINHSPGVPPSVTSIGPRGPVPNQTFITMQPHFPVHPPHNGNHNGNHHRRNTFFPAYSVPYYPVMVEQPYQEDQPDEDDYNGGPTIFDRRGQGQAAPNDYVRSETPPRPPEPMAAVSAPEVQEQVPTILVFKDGHQLEIANYAVVGETLYDLTSGHRRKIALSELDLVATAKENDDRGGDFQVPPAMRGN